MTHKILVSIAKDVVVLGAVPREIQDRILKNGNQIANAFHLGRTVAKFVGVVEVRKVAAGQARVGINQRLDHLGIDQIADIAVTFERNHILKAGALWNHNGRRKVFGVPIFIGNIFYEQHKQHIVLVLAGIHATAQLITGGPERGVEVGLLDRHGVDGWGRSWGSGSSVRERCRWESR